MPERLTADALYQPADFGDLAFASTDELQDFEGLLGQPRAVQAIEVAFGVRQPGFNLYAMGRGGLGKHSALRGTMLEKAAEAPPARDWCYVQDFDDPQRPRALSLPAGMAIRLRADLDQLIQDLLTVVPRSFASGEYPQEKQRIEERFEQRRKLALVSLGEAAEQDGIVILDTPTGYTLAPLADGKPMPQEVFNQLPEDEKKRLDALLEKHRKALLSLLREDVPIWYKETLEQLRTLKEKTIGATIERLVADIRAHYGEVPDVVAHLEALQQDAIANMGDILGAEDGPDEDALERYRVNVLVSNDPHGGAPLIEELNPSHVNLIGRIEHIVHMGTLVTNFTLIRPGALHRANGGYLLLDAHKVLTSPYAWEGLKSALQAREIRIQSLEQALGLVSTVSLEPVPIPLDVKVILVGEPLLYYLLSEYDPEFPALFKLNADFADDFERTPENTALYARLIATLVRREGLRPVSRDALGRLIEQASRDAGDAHRLSLHMRGILDLLREAHFYAEEDGTAAIDRAQVERAIAARIFRADRYREGVLRAIREHELRLVVEGGAVGQVNGLSVVELGETLIGRPSRITATVRLGEGDVIDIEREVELGGAIHSKGVMILGSFLGERYARTTPLSIRASLAFEQSYGPVEGDSASVAELCALLSAIARMPLSQALAVTGSVNQHGEVQAVGGINEKIEGFFDACQVLGPRPEQGVIIPRSNVHHLMLRADVVAAVREGRFTIHAADTVDEVMALLSGLPAGEADAAGHFPPESVNGRIQAGLAQFVDVQKRLAREMHGEPPPGDGSRQEDNDG
ncbi:AAA family ATPase [Thiofaba sp. EF100]|uniref:Lon protease family protein n=1 Tax=Thiofaba sp. EF100 TaxID=3121274 RepID=UPI0032218943